ncbi:MAG: hypothetical protein WCZ90_20375 [Melioribacteraceae bacterium]
MKKKNAKNKSTNNGLNPAYLDVLRRKCLIESTGASLRLSGRKISDEQVEEILRKMEEKRMCYDVFIVKQ